MSPPDLLLELLGDSPEFALLRRADTPDVVDVYIGEFTTWPGLADIALPTLAPHGHDRPVHDLLILVPFRQLAERGYACHDDGAPLRAMRVRHHAELPVPVVLAALPDSPLATTPGGFDIRDDGYADIVRRVQAAEIGGGAGSNFVIRRTWRARLGDGSARTGLTIFGRLLRRERGAYWTFVVHSRDRTLVGATPERHVSLRGATLTMNPISGTLRYPATGPTVDGLLRFLGDQKETDELSMVVDEELKMMGRVCRDVRVRGPYLREMARLAHTEYAISGDSDADVRDILSATLFAPTVVGSPLENACRVVATHERHGRGYYGGVLALIGRAAGGRTLDSAICLRAADIDSSGQLSVDVGASIVRDSEPAAEAAETTAKAAALLSAITGAAPPRSPESVPLVGRAAGTDPRVRAALLARNDHLASFWLAGSTPPVPVLAGRRLIVVDAEDGFTTMLAHQLRALGAGVVIRSYREGLGGAEVVDAVVVGPGPGDPRDRTDPRIATLTALTRNLLERRVPIFAVCLGHQLLATLVGLPVRRAPVPTQGTQREITFDGQARRVAFYNTFAAFCPHDEITCAITGDTVRVLREPATGEVYGLRRPGMASVQFHVESVLTKDGPQLLGGMLRSLLGEPAAPGRGDDPGILALTPTA